MSSSSSTKKSHDYKARLIWDGNLGTGTTSYTGYGRKYRLQIEGKPELVGSADPMFRGDGNVYNPEDLFVAALSSCHLLSYLALCARNGVKVVGYEDDAVGTMSIRPDGSGKFEEVTLRPVVTQVRAVLFVVDTVNTMPGTSGTIWLSGVALGVGKSFTFVR